MVLNIVHGAEVNAVGLLASGGVASHRRRWTMQQPASRIRPRRNAAACRRATFMPSVATCEQGRSQSFWRSSHTANRQALDAHSLSLCCRAGTGGISVYCRIDRRESALGDTQASKRLGALMAIGPQRPAVQCTCVRCRGGSVASRNPRSSLA
jgi:hypothetical protein